MSLRLQGAYLVACNGLPIYGTTVDENRNMTFGGKRVEGGHHVMVKNCWPKIDT